MDAIKELLTEAKYTGAKKLSAGLGVVDMSDFLNKNIQIQKKHSYRPKIELLITDYDGTVGNYYGKLTEMVDLLINHISKTRNLSRTEIENILNTETRKSEDIALFTGYAFFDIDGMKKILFSSYFYDSKFSLIDEQFINEELEASLHKMHEHIYPDALDLFKHCNDKGVPVIVHTNSYLSELIRKATLSGLIKFSTDENGKKHVEYSLIKGISAKKNKDNSLLQEEIKALNECGIFLISNPKEDLKPSPLPIYKILYELKHKENIYVPHNHILVLGNDLYDDGGVAYNAGVHYAWPSTHARLSNRDTEINRITAGGNPKFDHSIFGQMRYASRNLLNDDENIVYDFAEKTTICPSYQALYGEIYDFTPPTSNLNTLNLLEIMIEERQIAEKISSRPLSSRSPFNLSTIDIAAKNKHKDISLIELIRNKERTR